MQRPDPLGLSSVFGDMQQMGGAYATANAIRHACHYMDSEVGLLYCGRRYYSPSLGRFINRDPIAEAGGVNLYAYCGNNAAMLFDALGEDAYTENVDMMMFRTS